MPAPATLENSCGFSGTNMAQIINPLTLIYSKYFTLQLLFRLVTEDPVELLPTCVFSQLNVNELKILIVLVVTWFIRVRDHWFILLFVYVE